MSFLLYDPPGSVQRKVWTTASARQAIRDLAYNLRLERGSPYGSPDQDWAEAERQLNDFGYAIGPCLKDERRDAANGIV